MSNETNDLINGVINTGNELLNVRNIPAALRDSYMEESEGDAHKTVKLLSDLLRKLGYIDEANQITMAMTSAFADPSFIKWDVAKKCLADTELLLRKEGLFTEHTSRITGERRSLPPPAPQWQFEILS